MSDDQWTVEDEIEAALKPCPRCGGKAVLDDGYSNGIHCDGCGYWTGEDMDGEEAIEWWNYQPLIDKLRATTVEATGVPVESLRRLLALCRSRYEATGRLGYELGEAERWLDTLSKEAGTNESTVG